MKDPKRNTYTDRELWHAFRAGDDRVYEVIYQKYARELFNYGYCLTHDKLMVEDCIHDIFVYIYQHRTTLGETDSIKYYLFKAVRRRLFEGMQKQIRRAANDDLIHSYEEHEEFSPEIKWIEHESTQYRNDRLLGAIQTLPRRQREAIFLLYYCNLSYEQASEVMSLKVRTTYNQIHTALQTLRKYLKKLDLFPLYCIISLAF